jgi:hypothetical protein
LANEYSSIVKYNNAIANFEYSKGTLLKHNNVVISEGALPGVAQVRAVEHQRERSKALVLREHATPVKYEEFNPENGQVGLPTLPESTAPSLPALLKDAPEMPEMLPDPKVKPIGPEMGGAGVPSLRGMLKLEEPGMSVSDTRPEEKGLPLPGGISPVSSVGEVKVVPTQTIPQDMRAAPAKPAGRPLPAAGAEANLLPRQANTAIPSMPSGVHPAGGTAQPARPLMVQPSKAKALLDLPPD